MADPDHGMRSIFETRSHAWREAGLARQISQKAARRARLEAFLLVPAVIGVLLAFQFRQELFGVDLPVRIASVLLLLVLGWALARGVGRALGPMLFRRLDPGTAGTVGFLIRLGTVLLVLLIALRIAGLPLRTLAVGGAFTAVVVGLAAQQTLGNLFAGMILLSARPFRVGDRVRLQGGGVAGTAEGTVSALGLLYTTFSNGDDAMLVPNSVVLNVAVIPLREPAGVDLRARLDPGVTPADVQRSIEEGVETPVRGHPRVTLEELDDDELVVRIEATPAVSSHGTRLASEVLSAVRPHTRQVMSDGAGDGSGDGGDPADRGATATSER